MEAKNCATSQQQASGAKIGTVSESIFIVPDSGLRFFSPGISVTCE
jgi:hypothetical protein